MKDISTLAFAGGGFFNWAGTHTHAHAHVRTTWGARRPRHHDGRCPRGGGRQAQSCSQCCRPTTEEGARTRVCKDPCRRSSPGRHCFVKGCLAPPKKCYLVPTDRDTIRLLPVKKTRALAGEGVVVRWCRDHRCALADSKIKHVPKPKVAAPSAPTPGPTTRRRAEAVALSDTVNPEVVVPRPKAIKVAVSQPEGKPDKRVVTATAGVPVPDVRGGRSRGATNVVDRGQLVVLVDRGGACNTPGCEGRLLPAWCQDKDARSCIFRFVVRKAPGMSKSFLRKVAPAGSTGPGPRHRRGACWRRDEREPAEAAKAITDDEARTARRKRAAEQQAKRIAREIARAKNLSHGI